MTLKMINLILVQSVISLTFVIIENEYYFSGEYNNMKA